MDLGLYIGFDGPITFKNADRAREVVKYVPKEYILTETDSPYLAPEPKRGKLNTPENIPIILEKIASVKGLDLEELKSVVYLNAKNLFKKLKIK
jgi:TatD DNase family protein